MSFCIFNLAAAPGRRNTEYRHIANALTLAAIKMKNFLNKEYPIKVWFTTIFLTPVVNVAWLFIAFGYTANDIKDSLIWLVFMLGMGIILSVPAFLLFILAFYGLSKSKIHNRIKSCVFALLGMLLIFVTFYLSDREYVSTRGTESQIILGSYIVVFIISALHFNPESKVKLARAKLRNSG